MIPESIRHGAVVGAGIDHTYFTVKKDDLYAIVVGKSTGTNVTISSLPEGGPTGSVRSV